MLAAAFYDLQMWYPAQRNVAAEGLRKVAPYSPLRICVDEFSSEDFKDFVLMRDAFDQAVNQRFWQLRRVLEAWYCKADADREVEGLCSDTVCVEFKDKWTLIMGDQRFLVPRVPLETVHSFEKDIEQSQGANGQLHTEQDELIGIVSFHLDLCKVCANDLKTWVVELQERLWDDLCQVARMPDETR